MNKKNKQLITIAIFVIITIVIVVFFFVFFGREDEAEEPIKVDETHQPVLIETEFLSENELLELNVDPNTRAQVLSRDPLIYKVIKDDDEIVKDISPYLQPIRE